MFSTERLLVPNCGRPCGGGGGGGVGGCCWCVFSTATSICHCSWSILCGWCVFVMKQWRKLGICRWGVVDGKLCGQAVQGTFVAVAVCNLSIFRQRYVLQDASDGTGPTH